VTQSREVLINFVEWDIFGVVLVLFATTQSKISSEVERTALSIAVNSIRFRVSSLVTSILFDMIKMSMSELR